MDIETFRPPETQGLQQFFQGQKFPKQPTVLLVSSFDCSYEKKKKKKHY